MTLNQEHARQNNYQKVENFYNKELFGFWKSYVININGLLIEYHLALLINGDRTEDLLVSVKEGDLIQKFDLVLREEKITLADFEQLATVLLKQTLPQIFKKIY
jgi:hypothetical protein